MKKQHPSLTKAVQEKKLVKPAPLITSRELTAIARKALHEQVEKRIHELAVEASTVQQMAQDLKTMQLTLNNYLSKLGANESLEREVLEELKRKLNM